ncbi:fungal-specific transcription factor domain-containing protein [Mycena latifolia]|nr:fungal-specific transcription factor domain-containing protein [Mycena latifolia]
MEDGLRLGDGLSKIQRQRACDMCRRKKRRCDGGERCSRCLENNWTCTYVDPAANRAVYDSEPISDLYDNDYVENLKQRLEHAEAALAGPPLISRAIRSLTKPFTPPHPDDFGYIDIADSFRALSLEGPPPDPGFQGKSSAAMLVKAAVEVKPGQTSRSQIIDQNRPPKPWTLRPWKPDPRPDLSFPDDHLLVTLVSLYFTRVNAFLPLLHRPGFEQCLSQRLHRHHIGFASTLLLVCAVGSLYLTNADVSNQERQALGWRWYNQVELCGHKLRHQPTLYDLQAYCLAAEFLIFTSNPRFCWSIVSFGLRLTEDMGAHRFKARTITAEEELETRAVWILLLFDTQLSAALGRSPVFSPLEFDIDLASECNDEHWGISGPGYQPLGQPSIVVFFNCLLHLYRILLFTLQIFYCTTRTNMRLGITNLPAVALQVESALDKWFASIPPHLVWDPARPDTLFFDQSAAINCYYYYVRILVCRPFLPATRPGAQMHREGPPAVSKCTEAAQACISIADVHRRRRPDIPLLFSQTPVFTAAMVLLLNVWDKSSKLQNPSQALAHVHTGIAVLKSQQERWPSSVFSLSSLERLASMDPPDGANALWNSTADHNMDGIPEILGTAHPQHAGPEVIIPAFVGDEEIYTTRFHRPHNID